MRKIQELSERAFFLLKRGNQKKVIHSFKEAKHAFLVCNLSYNDIITEYEIEWGGWNFFVGRYQVYLGFFESYKSKIEDGLIYENDNKLLFSFIDEYSGDVQFLISFDDETIYGLYHSELFYSFPLYDSIISYMETSAIKNLIYNNPCYGYFFIEEKTNIKNLIDLFNLKFMPEASDTIQEWYFEKNIFLLHKLRYINKNKIVSDIIFHILNEALLLFVKHTLEFNRIKIIQSGKGYPW